ncbi:HesA/MoeB/ThiF family protein [Candidatus Nomurabacteria bacterium]|nr:HesA/MoeB/ThiF family protein [Candidatus Nomurabacteria bacterium]
MFSTEELKRYQKQLVLADIGPEGQKALKQSRVLCVGAGGLGCPSLIYLTATGVGELGIIDPDKVDLTNLHRQVLFTEKDIGQSKVNVAKEKLTELNHNVSIKTFPFELTSKNSLEIFKNYDLVLDGTDNFEAKFLINDTAVKCEIPVVYASLSQWEGQLATFYAKNGGPCYRCIYPAPPKEIILNCEQAGILGALAGVMGTLQTFEAIKVLLAKQFKHKNFNCSRLLHFDAMKMQFQTFKIEKDKNCPVCSLPTEKIELKETQSVLCQTDFDLAISVKEVQDKDSSQYVFIDIREPFEWALGHIENAIHWPLSKLKGNEFPNLDNTEKIILYCQSGIRTKEAIKLFKDHGYTNVSYLKEGFSHWQGPVVTCS